MSVSPSQVVQTLLSNPLDLANVKSVTTPDVTYVSLNEHNPELKAYLPWTGTHKGPEAIVKVLEGVAKTWETKAFEVRNIIEQGDRVASFGTFTHHSRYTGKDITSPFSVLAKLSNGKISYIQFMEDTLGTSGTVKQSA